MTDPDPALPEALIVVGDLHVNSTVGLCPPKVRRDDGGIYHYSDAQRWIWRCWRDFWKHVDGLQVSRRWVVLNGDSVESLHHHTTQLVSDNMADQLSMILEIAEPVAQKSDGIFLVRGTPAHSGAAGMWEELLAQRLGAIPDEVKKTASWYNLPLSIGGVRFDIGHHPQTSSRRLWLRDSAAGRQAMITWTEYNEMKKPPPDIVIRGHVHYFARGYGLDTLGVFAPPWQLTTELGSKLGTGYRIEPIGGLIFLCRGGEYTWYPKRYRPKPAPWWKSVILAKRN